MLVKPLLIPLLFLLLWSCGTNSDSAGFASETTNGEAATIQLSGDTCYDSTTLYLIPSSFNPTTDILNEDLQFTANKKGEATISLPRSTSYNLYVVNHYSGKKAFVKHFNPDSTRTTEVPLSPPGNVRVHFKKGNSIVDTTDGCVFFPGYIDFKRLQGNMSKNSEGFSVLFDSIPISISDSLFYSIDGNPEYSQPIGVAKITSNQTFDLYAKLLYKFITTQHFDIPSNNIETLVSIGDKLWIGTEGGISTIEESEITNKSTSWYEYDEKNRIRSICPIDNNSIYYGTESGVFKMCTDAKGNTFTTPMLDYTGPVNDLTIDKMGALWIATNRGVYKTYHGFVKHFTAKKNNLPSDTVNAIIVDSSGTAIGGTNRGLFYLSSEGTTKVVTSAMTAALHSDRITSLALTPKNNVWIGTENGGITLCTPDYWYLFYQYYEQLFAGSTVTDIEVSPDGIVWACTDEGTLLHGDRGYWTFFIGQGSIIPGVPINEVTIGNNGNIYCGTKGAGVFIIGPSYNFEAAAKKERRLSESFPDGALCTKESAP